MAVPARNHHGESGRLAVIAILQAPGEPAQARRAVVHLQAVLLPVGSGTPAHPQPGRGRAGRTTRDSKSRPRNSRSAVNRAGVARRAATARDGSSCHSSINRGMSLVSTAAGSAPIMRRALSSSGLFGDCKRVIRRTCSGLFVDCSADDSSKDGYPLRHLRPQGTWDRTGRRRRGWPAMQKCCAARIATRASAHGHL